MLDTKTLTEDTIKECRENETWLKTKVEEYAPEGTTCEIEELRVNDIDDDYYIFCEVTLTCNKRKHHFNFYAGTQGVSIVERLGGKKGEYADGAKLGKTFEMEFYIPSKDDMEDFEEFLEHLDKYAPKMPKKKKKANKHAYLLTYKSIRDNGFNGDEIEDDETLYETIEKAQKNFSKIAKDAIDDADDITVMTIDDKDYTEKTEDALKAIKNGAKQIEFSGNIDGDYFHFEAEITEKDVF